MRAMNIAATGMLAQQLNVEVISNNIANLNTTGFKRGRAEFQDLLYQTVERVGSATSQFDTKSPAGIAIGLGVKAGGIYRINDQGNLSQTSNKYDLAIDGRGYFKIRMPNGDEAYTRAGAFQVSANGELVTQEGYLVDPAITIPRDAVDVTISPSGQVQAKIAGQTEPQDVGQLELTNFANESGLESLGDNLMAQSPASGEPISAVPGDTGFGTLRQGFLETSNVNPVQEITNLITAQRAYEMNSKVIKTADEMMTTTNQLR
jgi:flagellar basal-body rod protein FlgG